MIGTIVAIALIALAAWILFRRAVRFARTKGRSACSSCPYSSSCCGGGGCGHRCTRKKEKC